ncbi:MAG: sulfur transferase domain-containing protein [Vicinamibacterales bacterium]
MTRYFNRLRGFSLAIAVIVAGLAPLLNAEEKETLAGAQNFTRIDQTFAAGGIIAVEAFPELKKRGFKSVINLRMPTERNANVEAEAEAVRAAGLKYIGLPFNVANANAREVVDQFLTAIGDPANQPTYVHSAQAHRVMGLWLIKRVRVDHWAVDRALAEAEAVGLSETSRQFALDYVKPYAR